MMAFATSAHTGLHGKARPCDRRSFTSAYPVIRKPMQSSLHSASQSLGGI